MARSNASTQNAYTRHGLELIRFSNGLSGSSSSELRALGKKLKTILQSGYDQGMSPREVNALIAKVNRTVTASYARISKQQMETLRELLDVELDFALTTSGFRKPRRSMDKVARGLLVHGAPIPDHWDRQGANIAWNLTTTIRAAASNNVPRRELFSTVIGTGRAGMERGGIIDTAVNNARSLVDSSVQSTAQAGHNAAYNSPDSDVKALMWHAVLDTKVCPNCAMRAGLLYTVDYKPIKHSVSMIGPPPFHPFCRCILIPWDLDDEDDEAPQAGEKFETWLNKQERETQEDLLGKGRVELWRKGTINMSQLVGQDGLVMDLKELRNRVARS